MAFKEGVLHIPSYIKLSDLCFYVKKNSGPGTKIHLKLDGFEPEEITPELKIFLHLPAACASLTSWFFNAT
jgi:hypothetical protein